MVLVVPGFPVQAARGTAGSGRYRALETLLARARVRTLPAGGVAGVADWLAGVRIDAGTSVAGICRLGEPGGETAGPGWLRADPVCLLPSGDRLRLLPPAALRIDARSAATLVRACNGHFAPEGHRLEAPHPRRWYLRPARPLRVATWAPEQVAGGDILAFLPAGPDAVLARRLMTEAQMILHDAAGTAGEAEVNSVWIWGEGRPPRPQPAALPALWSDEPYARGIWLLTGNRVQPLPADASQWLALSGSDGAAVLDAPPDAGRPWHQALERDWCAPLLAALARGELASLDVVGGRHRYTLTRVGLRRFWRRRRPLAGRMPHAH